MEYARAHERHYSSYFYFIDKLLFIDKTLRAKLNSPVYLQCRKHKKKINLKKTNVFAPCEPDTWFPDLVSPNPKSIRLYFAHSDILQYHEHDTEVYFPICNLAPAPHPE